MAGKSQTSRLMLGLSLSVFFLYLTIFKPHLGSLFSGELSVWESLFGTPRFNISDLGKTFRDAEWGFIAMTGAIFFATLVLRAWRWQKILAPLVKMPFSEVFGAMSIGYMANNVLPLRLGEVYRAQVVHQLSGLERSAAFGTIIVERLVDLLFMIPFIGLALLLYPLPEVLRTGAIIASITAFALVGFCVWLGVDHDRAMRWTRKVFSIFPEQFAEKLITIIEKFTAGLGVLGKRELFWMLATTSILLWIMYAAMVYLVLASLGLAADIPLIADNVVGSTLVILFVTTFGFIIPGAPGAVGTYHGVAVLGLSLFGVPGDRAAGFAIMLHALNYIPLTMLGWAYFWKYGLSFKKSAQAVNDAG